jgi:Arc/MetJ-type ribon-helix-helix transcriptional regulator
MTIHIPPALENPILAAVHSGRYATLDDAMTKAASLLLEELRQEQTQAKLTATAASPDPVLGCMRDDAELMDEIVADAYRHRREDTWREFDL